MKWTDEWRAQLRRLAASGLAASEIGNLVGASKPSVMAVAIRNGIPLILHTEAELADMRALARLREKRKRIKRRSGSGLSISVDPGTTKTSPVYRNQLPRLPDGLSKNELRAMIAEAVRNTAEMAA